MSSVVKSAGGVPSGLEIVGACPATAETTGRTVSSEADICIPPRTVAPISMAAITAATTLRTLLLIFELLYQVEIATAELALVAIHF